MVTTTKSPTTRSLRSKAVAALLLILPVQSLCTLIAMVFLPGTKWALVATVSAKLWMVGLPILWLLKVDGKRLGWSKPTHGGFLLSFASGLLISAVIVAAYWFIGRQWIDTAFMRKSIKGIGLGTPMVYVAATAYYVIFNAVLEEYVWRWFVVEKFNCLLSHWWAIIASAFCFTVHHVVALNVYFPWQLTALANVGVFTGGIIWSWTYLRYRSIWPGYLSHAIVDVTIFAIGYSMVFGSI